MPAAQTQRALRTHGFTLVELLVVMAILALLLALTAPKYFDSVDRAKEAALRTDLRVMREALDKHHADTGRWPESLDALVRARYLRSVPADPFTERSDSWLIVPAADGVAPGVHDIRSGAPGTARDGSAFASW
jgi:general secretion pathway protein G